MSEQQARPVQATLAGGLVVGGSLLLVALVWERIGLLHTLEVREAVEDWLATNELSGLSVEDVTATLQVLCVVGGGAAAAAAILGLQVFRRSATARRVLTGLAPLLLVGGLATGTPLGIFPVLGVAMLWAQPTRDWYAGRPWAQRYQERREQRLSGMRSGSPTLPGPQQPGPQQPGPQQPGPQQPGPQQPGPQQPAAGPVPPPPPGPSVPSGPHAGRTPERPLDLRRPPALTGGCVLTWVLTPLVALGGVLSVLSQVDQSDQVFADMKEQRPGMVESSGMTESDVVAMFWVLAVGLVLWCVAAAVLAGLAWIGQDWARIVLAVSGVCAAVLSLLVALGSPLVLVLVLSIGLGVRMLLRPEVAAWYRLRRAPRLTR